jgi:hypothetical protein
MSKHYSLKFLRFGNNVVNIDHITGAECDDKKCVMKLLGTPEPIKCIKENDFECYNDMRTFVQSVRHPHDRR